MKRILNYPGSKWDLANRIIGIMPPHQAYCEPFFGSGAVFFNKQVCRVETINDIDGRLMNMFKQVRDYGDELARLLHLTPYARGEYDLSFNRSDDPLEDARRMFVRCWMAIGGKTAGKSGWRRNVKANGSYNTRDWDMLPVQFDEVIVRLKHVQIETKPAITLIRELDKHTLLYIDPPYLRSTRTSYHYAYEMNEADHIELLQTLVGYKGAVILSGYESDLYNEYLNGWYTITESARVGSTNPRRKQTTEVVYTNFKPWGQQSMF